MFTGAGSAWRLSIPLDTAPHEVRAGVRFMRAGGHSNGQMQRDGPFT
jgi:hypothetical protein